MPIATTWVHVEIVTLREVSQTEKDKYHTTMCGILKNDTNELIHKAEIESQMYKTNLWTPGGKR